MNSPHPLRGYPVRKAPTMTALAARLHTAWHLRPARRGERGDVPGWVLVTLMSALLVAALLVLARDRLLAMFNQAMDSVTG